MFLQGALQGIGFLFSSGDNGDELANTGTQAGRLPGLRPLRHRGRRHVRRDRRRRHVQLPDRLGHREVQPVAPTASSWTPLGFLYGAGGGTRPCSTGRLPERCRAGQLGSGRRCRTSALDADPTTGMLIGQTQTFPDGAYYGEYRIGGTSLASPLFAGHDGAVPASTPAAGSGC